MKTVLAAPELLSLEKVTLHAEAIILVAHTVQLEVRCPCCKTVATKVHSRYVRQVADLPWAGLAVRLELHTRKFFCRNDRCQRQIFCERLPSFVASSARQTIRFNEALTFLGMMLGGQAGARMGHAMGLGISPDTLLARVRQTVAQRADAPPIRVLGVDDFAFRRGQRYGTLLGCVDISS